MTRPQFRTLCLLISLSFLTFPAAAEIVRHVVDGDTLVLDNEDRVRLIGVDAPEVDNAQYQRVGEYYGDEARSYLRERLEGRTVRLESDTEPHDKYGRRLAYVYLEDVLINAELIEQGFAEAMHFFEYRQKDSFLALEKKARESQTGIWAAPQVRQHEQSSQALSRAKWVVLGFVAFLALFLFVKKI